MNALVDCVGERVPKAFRGGTDRAVDPEVTVERATRWFAPMGITRVADITGLDRIGIPVIVVVRPNSRSLSVAQGKGADLPAARASGVMESIESYHAEHMELPLLLESWDALRFRRDVADVTGLPYHAAAGFGPTTPILWIESHDLLGGGPVWVPYELVHTNYTLPLPSGSGVFLASSNGLASGNHLVEAMVHGVSEVIERDATTLFELLDADGRAGRRLDLGTVDDPGCCSILDRFSAAGVAVSVWDTTSDVGVASFRCVITEAEENPFHLVHPAAGMGCHPMREIALARALTEAAQSRLTIISGSRDDVLREDYERVRSPEVQREERRRSTEHGLRRFGDVPTFDSAFADDDLRFLLDRLRAIGIEQVLAVDLTREEFGIPVVRIVVPGLEGPSELTGWTPGARARSQMVPA